MISNNKSAKNAIINGREDNVKIKKIEDNLAKYIKLKRINIEIGELYKKIISKKMIII